MIRSVAKAALFAAILAGFAAQAIAAQAQQFSADIVRENASGQPQAGPGKIYVSDGKIRIETPDMPDGFFVVDASIPVSYFVRSTQHVFMESRQSSELTQLLVPVDVTDPCRQWQAMHILAAGDGASGTWRCRRIAQATIGGRDTIHFLVSSPRGRNLSAWIDARLKWPVRLKMADGTIIGLDNIREQPQSADLFEIPRGYSKFDPRALLDRIKQSDVWVEPQQ